MLDFSTRISDKNLEELKTFGEKQLTSVAQKSAFLSSRIVRLRSLVSTLNAKLTLMGQIPIQEPKIPDDVTVSTPAAEDMDPSIVLIPIEAIMKPLIPSIKKVENIQYRVRKAYLVIDSLLEKRADLQRLRSLLEKDLVDLTDMLSKEDSQFDKFRTGIDTKE